MDHTFISPLWEYITFESFLKFAIAYFFVIWIALLVWGVRDITNRTDNVVFQIVSILVILLGTPLGIVIYLLIRPGKTLFERYYDEVEDNLNTFSDIIEEKTQKLGEGLHCSECGAAISHDFHFCPECRFELKHECGECGKDVFKSWENCPYCGVKQEIKKKSEKKIETKKEENKKNISEKKADA